MSISTFIEVGLTLFSMGAVIGFWIHASRHSEPRDVMLLIGSTLAPSSRCTRREREY